MKSILPISLCLIFFLGCLKPNSVVPITEVQQQMAGIWKVDSSVTVYNKMFSNKESHDTVYTNHFVTITNTGNVVHISMQGTDIMNYTIDGNFLQPYTSSSALNISVRGSMSCGAPYSLTQFSLSPNSFHLIANDGVSTTTTYMHK